MGDIQNDVRFIKEALPEIQDYLLSNQLYWPLPGFQGSGQSANYYRLTPGNLLISRIRLLKWPSSLGQEGNLKQLDGLRDQWRSHWLMKVNQEIPARLILWSEFLQESLREGNHQTSYNYHVRIRLMLELLLKEDPSKEQIFRGRIMNLDNQLNEITTRGPFVWETELQVAFPETEFAYLYRAIPGQKGKV